MAWASVCPCVCVTLCSPIKTVQTRTTKSLLWAAATTVVYGDKISCPWVRRFPSNEGVKEGYPLKNVTYFAAIDLSGVKTVADRSRHDAYDNKH